MVLEDNKDPQPRTLDPFKLEEYLARGQIDITTQEIQDRSKGDSLSKGLVMVQMSWFIFQCTARKLESLPITELELVTLAFAMLNLFTYGIWWNKPLSVQCPYRVLINRKPMSEEKEETRGDGTTEAETEIEVREDRETELERLTQRGQKGMSRCIDVRASTHNYMHSAYDCKFSAPNYIQCEGCNRKHIVDCSRLCTQEWRMGYNGQRPSSNTYAFCTNGRDFPCRHHSH